jgi:hypothetical protein
MCEDNPSAGFGTLGRALMSQMPDPERPILVFLGPTMRLEEAKSVLDAVYLRPASQGDVILAAHAFHPRVMVLIDGQFEDRPAVRHKEILWAMAQGIVVIGAASMGALRAAELDRFGMIGVGLIYRWYRRWKLAPDDAVAVQSAPAELGHQPLTQSLVDLQRTFSALRRQKVITQAEHVHLTAIARGLNFRERKISAVLGAADWQPEMVAVMRNEPSQKKVDALKALRLAKSFALESNNKELFEWVSTNTFERDLATSGIDTKLISNYKNTI